MRSDVGIGCLAGKGQLGVLLEIVHVGVEERRNTLDCRRSRSQWRCRVPGGLWQAGKLADRPVTGFTSTATLHGGQESTLLSMYPVFMHWGSLIVPPGYTDPSAEIAGGSPYGASSLDREDGPNPAEFAAARYQGRRLAEKTAALTHGIVARAA